MDTPKKPFGPTSDEALDKARKYIEKSKSKEPGDPGLAEATRGSQLKLNRDIKKDPGRSL